MYPDMSYGLSIDNLIIPLPPRANPPPSLSVCLSLSLIKLFTIPLEAIGPP